MKVGLIRCMQTEDMYPGTTDFKVMKEKKCAFEGIEGEIEVIGFSTCGVPRQKSRNKSGGNG